MWMWSPRGATDGAANADVGAAMGGAMLVLDAVVDRQGYGFVLMVYWCWTSLDSRMTDEINEGKLWRVGCCQPVTIDLLALARDGNGPSIPDRDFLH
jgi:hypothetical protein